MKSKMETPFFVSWMILMKALCGKSMIDIMPTASVDTSAYNLRCKNIGRGTNLDAVRSSANAPKMHADLENHSCFFPTLLNFSFFSSRN
jgi:hypothetical protein